MSNVAAFVGVLVLVLGGMWVLAELFGGRPR